MKLLLLILLLTPSHLTHAISVCIIVPGTWSAAATWHQPGGDFFEALKNTLDCPLLTFTWSGAHNHNERVKVAAALADLIKHYDGVCLVTHSHGSNVAFLASQLLGTQGYKGAITAIYALATPVNGDVYAPDMDVITYLYQFFSYADMVQPVLGLFERVFPEHERIANIAVTINGTEPDHSTMHHPVVAQWLTWIPHTLQEQKIGNFHHFSYTKPGIIHFKEDALPWYDIDYERDALLAQDAWLQQKLACTYERKIDAE
jgi:hypothetical protein